MLGIHDLPLFVLSGVLLNLTPGVDTLFILSHAARGWRAGAMAALGIGAGCLVHIVGATIGLSALLLASSTAFAIVKGVGALYLVWIGLSMLIAKPAQSSPDAAPAAPLSDGRIFLRGALTNALNPKVAMFFLAFLPQFVDPTAEHRAFGFLVLGAVFDFTGTLWNLTLARLAAGAIARRPGALAAAGWVTRGVGALFVALGVKLAFATRSAA